MDMAIFDRAKAFVGPYFDPNDENENHCVLSWPMPEGDELRGQVRSIFKEALTSAVRRAKNSK